MNNKINGEPRQGSLALTWWRGRCAALSGEDVRRMLSSWYDIEEWREWDDGSGMPAYSWIHDTACCQMRLRDPLPAFVGATIIMASGADPGADHLCPRRPGWLCRANERWTVEVVPRVSDEVAKSVVVDQIGDVEGFRRDDEIGNMPYWFWTFEEFDVPHVSAAWPPSWFVMGVEARMEGEA